MANAAYLKSPRRRYTEHKARARRCKIEFKMTFDEWFLIWTESGHWDKRGRRRGQYVMARFADSGAYEVGNVRICTSDENYHEAVNGNLRSADAREKMAVANRGKPKSVEHRAKLSVLTTAQFSDSEARQRASEKQLAYLARQQCPM